jgi:CheY-like chemotaxis protein
MDDDPKISMLTARMLQTLGYTYDLARNGEQAIELYQHAIALTKPYDAVIMDLTVIGGMGGEECFGELQKIDPDVRAIVATGYDNADTRQRFLAKGFRGFLAKPYRVPELGKALKDILT